VQADAVVLVYGPMMQAGSRTDLRECMFPKQTDARICKLFAEMGGIVWKFYGEGFNCYRLAARSVMAMTWHYSAG
jgi:hypothetical protein